MNNLPDTPPDAPPDAPPDIPLELCVAPRYPARLKKAGIVWVVYGCLMVAASAYTVLPMMMLENTDMKSIGRESAPAFFGIMFLAIGYPVCCQSLQFPAFGAKLYGICSILMSFHSVLRVFEGIGAMPPGNSVPLENRIFYTLGGIALMTAGMLAIKARHDYRTWHEWNKAMKINGTPRAKF